MNENKKLSTPHNDYFLSKIIKHLMKTRQTTQQIFVRNLSSQTITLDVSPKDSVLIIKWLILKRERILQVSQQNLWFSGRLLNDIESLEEQGISAESTLQLSAKM